MTKSMSENPSEIPITENVEPPEVKVATLTLSETEMRINDSLQKSVQRVLLIHANQ